MTATINSVATIDNLMGNTLTVEVIPNNLQNGGLQFYSINNANGLNYVNYEDFNNKLKDSIKKNNPFYITFCGISNKDITIPEYLYLVFNGNEVQYKPYVKNNMVFLEFKLKKNGRTIEQEIDGLFTKNVGVFVQAYL